MRSPFGVDLCKETGDLPPAGAFAGLAGFADEDEEEIESVPGRADAAVRATANKVAEGCEKLEEDRGGIRFGVWGQAAHGETGQTMESFAGHHGGRLDGFGVVAGMGVLGFEELLEFLGLFHLLKVWLRGFSQTVRAGSGGLGGIRRLLLGLIGEQFPIAALDRGSTRQRDRGAKRVVRSAHAYDTLTVLFYA
jgi:hypothetical protein